MRCKTFKSLTEKEIDEVLWNEEKEFYLERPVDLDTFLFDNRYLGNVYNDNGKSKIFEFWLKLLRKIYPSPFYTPYQEIIMSCAIGVGKSTVTTVSMLYELYKLLCLKNPAQYYGLMVTDTIVMALFSSTKENVGDVNWGKMKDSILASPWFQERLKLDKVEPKIKSLDLTKNVAIQLGSRYQHAIGRDVLIAVVDEGNNKLLTDQVKTNYTEIYRRRNSRFKDGFNVPGILWLISSPKTVDDFLNERISASTNDDSVLVIDNVPTWVAKKGKNHYCGKKFYVYLGDEQHDPRVLSKHENYKTFSADKIMIVPIEHYKEFAEGGDLMGAIRDVGGMRVQASTALFKSKEVITRAIILPSIFTKDTIHLDVRDKYQDIIPYLDTAVLKKNLRVRNKRYIHLDAGLTGDSFGIAATYSAYKDVMSINQDMLEDEFYAHSLDRKYIVDWAIRFRAKSKKGVPYNTIAQFLLYLKKLGYPIAKITGDKPSITVLQDLHILGFETAYMSVDTTRQPYITFMQKMYDGSIACCNNKVLVKELIHLRDDGDKIDHCCLAGDTQILYSNMQAISIKELADKGICNTFKVLSKDDKLCTVEAIALNAHKAKTVNKYIELELDNGKSVKCTLDHKFMLKDGSYKEAQYLTERDDLMEY